MAFDPENHVIDSRSGFMMDKETGRPVGLIGRPTMTMSRPSSEWPKWVPLHDSFIERPMGRPLNAPLWPGFHVDREGNMTVMAADADEATYATTGVMPEKTEE